MRENELVREIKKDVTINGTEFDEKSKAENYEYISQIVKKNLRCFRRNRLESRIFYRNVKIV